MSDRTSLFNDFSEKSDNAKLCMSAALAAVESGKVPTEEECQNISGTLADLRQAYSAIRSAARAVDPDVSGDETALVYHEAIKNYEANRFESRINAIVDILKKFMLVSSDSEDYDKALQPYRDEVKKTLDAFGNSENLASKAETDCSREEAFLKAVEGDGLSEEEKESAYDVVEHRYSGKVYRGVLSGKYSIGETDRDGTPPSADARIDASEDVETAQDAIDDEVSTGDTEPSLPEQKLEEPEDIDEGIVGVVAEEGDNNEQAIEDDLAVADVTVEKEATGQVEASQSIEYAVVSLADDAPRESDKMVSAISPYNPKNNTSATSFKKDLLKPAFSRSWFVLPMLSLFGALTEKQLLEVNDLLLDENDKDAKHDEIICTIEALRKKSAISSFPLKEGELAHSLTLWGRSLLGKSSVVQLKFPDSKKPYWLLSIGNNDFVANAEASLNQLMLLVEHSDRLISYLRFFKTGGDETTVLARLREFNVNGGLHSVPVRWGLEIMECLFVDCEADLDLDDANILFAMNEDVINCDLGVCRNAFLFDGEKLFHWEGFWADSVGGDQLVGDDSSEGFEAMPVEIDSDTLGSVDSESDLDNSAKGPSQDISHVCFEKEDDEAASGLGDEDPFSRALSLEGTPSDDEFVGLVFDLLDERPLIDPEDQFSNLAAALALSKAAATIDGNEKSQALYKQLLLATDAKLGQADRTGAGLSRLFTDYSAETEAIVFSSYCIALFAPQMPYDYNLQNTVETFLGSFEELFPSLSAYKPLLVELNKIHEASPEEGLSNNVLDLIGDQAKRGKRLGAMMSEAKELINPPKIKAKLNGIPEFVTGCFGKGSNLGFCMQTISEDNHNDADIVREVYQQFCPSGESVTFAGEREVEDFIDEQWRQAVEGKKTSHVRKLGSEPRKKTQDGIYARLDLIGRWLAYDPGKVDAAVIGKATALRDSILSIIDEISTAGEATTKAKNAILLSWMTQLLKRRLEGSELERPLFASFLKSGFITLDDDMMPIIDKKLGTVLFFEPWRNVVCHITSDMKQLAIVRDDILDESSPVFDNLSQLMNINKLLPDGASGYEVTEKHVEQAEISADAAAEKFQDSLEIAYAYSQLNEVQKEELAQDVETFQSRFYGWGDYGNWRRFLNALSRQVELMSKPLLTELSARLDSCKATLKRGSESTLLQEAERLLFEEQNFTVVEDYLNRFESGQTELTTELSSRLHDPDYFSEFISDSVFKLLYDECIRHKGAPFASFAKNYIQKRYPAEWTSRQKESCEALVSAWPNRLRGYSGEDLAKLLKSFGFKVRGIPELQKKEKREVWHVTVRAAAPDMPDYNHPIAAFGTQLKSPMSVVVLYGNHTPQEILDAVASEGLVGESLVLVNHPISLQARRQMAEFFHTRKSRLTSFLLIDQVLAMYLALHEESERMSLMLRCTLPFTYYQPFVRDGGATADEMFCGRERELRAIVDPNGASVVYGGRQLGKTALLQRAESLTMKPSVGEYAIYVSILTCKSEEQVAQAVSDSMNRAGLNIPLSSSLRDLSRDIDKAMKADSLSRILLLIDECDDFLGSISSDGYRVLQPLVDLKRETKNKFKFVLAGLHNVSRAKNATSRNGIFGQLGEPLCIKPLSPGDALRLISRPLNYLGFQVDRYPHLETILTSTNYYPGIIQFFGYTLIETMTKQYGDYYRAVDDNPPYTLHKEQLGAIMNSADLNNSIKEKFRWSLELDPRYFMIARCIACLSYDAEEDPESDDDRRGFSNVEIKEWADSLGIICLENETARSYVNLLDEMVDMGILSKPEPETARYRFRRNPFRNIVGADIDRILTEIDENNTITGD